MKTSVAICTYNGEKYIAEQIESILNQTVKPDEIIISDDGSKDRTLEIVERLLSNSEINYTINKNKTTLGISKNYDKCFSICTGDIIFFGDQDNVWKPNYVEEFLKCFKGNENLVYVFCNGEITDENLNVIQDSFTEEFMKMSNDKHLYNAINKISFPHGHTIAVRKTFLDKILPSGFYPDEWIADCAFANGNTAYINKKLIYFRRHNNSASAAGKKRDRANPFQIFKKDFDTYFVWPYHQYMAYKKYIDITGEKLNVEILSVISEHIEFLKKLNELRDYGFFERESKLLKLYKSKQYNMYRGNRNTYILDAFYLLHKNNERWKLNYEE